MMYSQNEKSGKKKANKLNLENSPENEKFEKSIEDLIKYLHDGTSGEAEILKLFVFFSDISKKSKYQSKILETSLILQTIKELLLKPASNQEITMECVKIILNLSKNRNCQTKMVQETDLSFTDLFEILLVNLNSNLTFYILSSFSYLTESPEVLDIVSTIKGPSRERLNENLDEDDPYYQINAILSKIDLAIVTRTFVEKILDDLNSNNKKIMLKIINNLYSYNKSFITKEAIEPIIRCLGNKSNDVVISALKILLFFTRDKAFHNDLIGANCIFRLVRTYKQGIDEMDMVIVKILYDLFDNKTLYELLFENNVLLILSNYLTNFEVEKNEKYEEVIRNVFEIFKLINKNTDDDSGKNYHNIVNPLIEDEALQLLIFKKAYSLAAFSKSENSILSCLSILQIMLSKFSSSLLSTNESIKSIIELVPPFFKNKNIEIIKYSLSIFSLILDKKNTYFQETYAQSSNQTFSIKSLVHSIINLVNEFSGNYELLSMSCKILVNLSDIPKLQVHFLQEPQITVLKVFNDNLLKQNKFLRKEMITIKNRIASGNYTNANNSINNTTNKLNNVSRGNESQNNANNNTSSRKLSQSQRNSQMRTEEKDRNSLVAIDKKIFENTLLLKDSLNIISNLSKNVDNLEILTLKGFLDIITEKLNDNDTETLPYVCKCIQGFCQGQASIEIILKIQIISKILTTYKLYKKIDEEGVCKIDKNPRNRDINKIENMNNSNMNQVNNLSNAQNNLNNNLVNDLNIIKKDKSQNYSTTSNRLDVLQSLKNILESDIKLQKTFIIERGIEILLNDVSGEPLYINEALLDQLNETILRVIYVVSCNINKLFLIYFSNDDEQNNDDSKSNSVNNESENDGSEGDRMTNKKKQPSKKDEDAEPKGVINTKNIKNDRDYKNQQSYDSSLHDPNKKEGDEEPVKSEGGSQNNNSNKNNCLKIFTNQLSEKNFMNKLLEVGEFDINSLSTFKELTKILINLYLNRYYLKYFTTPRVFDKVINIVGNIMKKFKENTGNESNYEILKLIVIFLKFICEDENLIKQFLREEVISILLGTVNKYDFGRNIKEDELEQYYYNLSLVLLRLTEFTGHVDKFKNFPDFFQILEKLYDNNLMNGKIYIISIIRNIIAEKQDFFNEDDLSRFLNKIVTQGNSFIIYEFMELIKNLVHNRSMCKRMENVFKYLITEIKSNSYSSAFKKKMLDLILCLSYENANIKDYGLNDLLSLVKGLDVHINQKTTLLILMNFSSISSNFSYLMQDDSMLTTGAKNKKASMAKQEGNNEGDGDGNNENENKNNLLIDEDGNQGKSEGIQIKKQDFINVINHLIDSDRFSQILIQRLLINITSIEGIDMSIISDKIMRVLIEILQKNKSLQENIIVFALATLVNISNRNILKFEKMEEAHKQQDENLDGYIDQDSNDIPSNERNSKKGVNINQKKDKNEQKVDNSGGNEVIIVDYLLKNLPNIVEIIHNLFDRNNLDISSLTIMFACNILRKIKFSNYYALENDISDCVEKYVTKEQKLNAETLATESGKFLMISIIKYCICLCIENMNKSDISKYILLTDIIMKLFKDNTNNIKKFKLTLNDIKDNTINFACVENQLNFFNMILTLTKQKANDNYFFTYNSQKDLRNYIGIFFINFLSDYSELLNSISNNVIANRNNSVDTNAQTKQNIVEINPSFQNVLINTIKLVTEYIAEIQIINDVKEKKTKVLRKKLNVDFFNKIAGSFEKIITSLLIYKPSDLNDELKSLIVYVLFIIFSNNYNFNVALKEKEKEKKEQEEKEKEKESLKDNSSINKESVKDNSSLNKEENENKTEGNDASKLKDDKMPQKMNISDNLLNNIELIKWIMKIFILSNNSIQNDFFCLKLFTIIIHSEKYPDVFYQSARFIKKLINFLSLSEEEGVTLNNKKKILQVESERILNIISFNPNSHKILYSMGVYNIFKTNLYVKSATQKENCKKEDFILLVNMILNKSNKEYIQDDIKGLLQSIFPCKELANNLRVELFDIFMSYTVETPNEKKFHEDYLIIFNLLYDNLKENFSEMIFLFDKFTKTYQNFAKKFLSDDTMVVKIFYDFLEYDKNFPSKAEELNCYLKILELFCEVGNISDKIEKMVNEMMFFFTRKEAKNNLRDINILNSILNFAFLFFNKWCEKKQIDDFNVDNSEDESSNEEEKSESDENSKEENSKKNNSMKKKKNTAEQEEKLMEFVEKFHYNKLIDMVIDNSINNNEVNSVYVLTMLIIQEDFKSMLLPLKLLKCSLFKKEFLMSFFKIFFNFELVDIKEFVFVIHLAIILSNVGNGNNKLEFAEEFANLLIDIYEKHIIQQLENDQKKEANEENEEENENDNQNKNTESNSSDIITSIYFFCDFVKINDLSIDGLYKVLKFIIKIISTYKNYLIPEQKEILIRYYQEILLHYRINASDDLNIHAKFFKTIHEDNDLSFIENLVFGTILINTRRDVLLKNLKEFYNIITSICLERFDKKCMINFFKFCKQLFIIITNNNSLGANANIGEQSKQCLSSLNNFVNNSAIKYISQIKEDSDLSRKYEKMKAMFNS